MSYASKKSAVRAAKKSGLERFEIVEENGVFSFIVPEAHNENEPTETVEIDNEVQGDETAPAVIEYVLPNEDRPVAFVWAFLAANRDKAERKTLIKHMIALGYNANMTKTQTSRFYSVDGDKDAYLTIEKMKRDAERAHLAELAAKIKIDREAAEAAEADENAMAALAESVSEGDEQAEDTVSE